MRVAGIGFRRGATLDALASALDAAGAADALATLDSKADAPQLRALARARGLPIISVPQRVLLGRQTITQSPDQVARFDTGSLAEGCALVAAGTGSRLIAARCISPCGTATAAIAEGAT